MRASGNQMGNSEKPKPQNSWDVDEVRSGKSSDRSTLATATFSNPDLSRRLEIEIQNCDQISKSDASNVASGLDETALKSVKNQGCNPTVPRLEGSSRDQHNTKALVGNISDKFSLVGLLSSSLQKAQEISRAHTQKLNSHC